MADCFCVLDCTEEEMVREFEGTEWECVAAKRMANGCIKLIPSNKKLFPHNTFYVSSGFAGKFIPIENLRDIPWISNYEGIKGILGLDREIKGILGLDKEIKLNPMTIPKFDASHYARLFSNGTCHLHGRLPSYTESFPHNLGRMPEFASPFTGGMSVNDLLAKIDKLEKSNLSLEKAAELLSGLNRELESKVDELTAENKLLRHQLSLTHIKNP